MKGIWGNVLLRDDIYKLMFTKRKSHGKIINTNKAKLKAHVKICRHIKSFLNFLHYLSNISQLS